MGGDGEDNFSLKRIKKPFVGPEKYSAEEVALFLFTYHQMLAKVKSVRSETKWPAICRELTKAVRVRFEQAGKSSLLLQPDNIEDLKLGIGFPEKEFCMKREGLIQQAAGAVGAVAAVAVAVNGGGASSSSSSSAEQGGGEEDMQLDAGEESEDSNK
eukprot:Cvel_23449.t1-p1 / transcript=Cvel_23449.t1 / gene=Cvel_23449 / organism=Chromera_velia_CCMP2878 / gene_product=hypothetical protein / transcript_product=hypothetical protein / location=Cvel_scaffold2418:598-1065(+) / protein_length=156 / sequence_SO=supercontig / SO=protein_coding / is_pseudo=false